MLAQLTSARSLLFLPGDDARKVEKSLTARCDAIVFDLEDGVAGEHKDDARSLLRSWLEAPSHAAKLVRVNDSLSAAGQTDLSTVAALPPVIVVVPKANLPSVEAAAEVQRPLVGLVEDAAGVLDAPRLAAHPAVIALALGTADLRASLQLHDDGTENELLYARSSLVMASGAARIRAPFDGPCLDIRDPERLHRETVAARNLGFGGKICIHPGQLDTVHRCFAPSAAEVDSARRVLAAWDARGSAAIATVEGKFVDRPIVLHARAVLEAYERSESDG